MHVISQEQLPRDEIAREFVGDDHGGVAVSFLLVDVAPGGGPALHRHEYDEVVIVQEGQATWMIDGEERVLRAGAIAVVRAGEAHRFVNSGDGPLRQVDIHLNSRFVTEWLEPPIAAP